MAVTGTALATTVIFNAVIVLVCFLAFSHVRVAPFARRFFSPKRYNRKVKEKPQRLPLSFFSWVFPIWRFSEDEIIRVCGLDTAVYLRLLDYGITLFAWVSFWTLAVILPLNVTGDFLSAVLTGTSSADSTTAFTELDRLSISNVKPGSARFWGHVITVYVISYFSVRLLWNYSKDVARLKVKFLAMAELEEDDVSSRTVLVTDIPGIPYGTPLERLHALAHGTLFRVLPASVRQRIDDTFEATFSMASAGARKVSSLRSLLSGNLKYDESTAELEAPGAQAVVVGSGVTVGPGVVVGPRVAVGPGVEVAPGVVVGQPPGGGGGGGAGGGGEAPVGFDPAILDPWTEAVGLLAHRSMTTVVEGEMRQVYGASKVRGVTLVRKTDDIEPILNRYEGVKTALEDTLDYYASKLRFRKPYKQRMVKVLPPLYGSWATERYGRAPADLDALTFYTEALRQLKAQIDTMVHRVQHSNEYVPAAFVTFSNRYTAVIAATSLHNHDTTCWRIQAAPGCEEILWRNVRMRYWERSARSLAAWGSFWVLVLFYLPVCAVIQGPVNIDNVSNVPVLGVLATLPVVSWIIQGVLPGVVLKLFLMFLPGLLAFMMRLAGSLSESRVDFGVVLRYFIFQYFAVFVFTFVTGSALSQIRTIIDTPTSIITLLGISAPQQANFFMNYTAVSIGAAAISLLRPVGLVLYWVRSRLAATDRAKTRLWSDQTMEFGSFMADHTIILMLGLTFCTVSPLIAPICLLYFLVCTIVDRYQLIYVYTRTYEAAGTIWQPIFSQLMVSLYTYQLLTICLLAIKRFTIVPILIPVPILTCIFHRSMIKLFEKPWQLLSLKAAARIDLQDAAVAAAAAAAEKRQHSATAGAAVAQRAEVTPSSYDPPAFRVSQSELDQLLEEAQSIANRINGNVPEPHHHDEDHHTDEDESVVPDVEAPAGAATPQTHAVTRKASPRKSDSNDGVNGAAAVAVSDGSMTGQPTVGLLSWLSSVLFSQPSSTQNGGEGGAHPQNQQ